MSHEGSRFERFRRRMFDAVHSIGEAHQIIKKGPVDAGQYYYHIGVTLHNMDSSSALQYSMDAIDYHKHNKDWPSPTWRGYDWKNYSFKGKGK